MRSLLAVLVVGYACRDNEGLESGDKAIEIQEGDSFCFDSSVPHRLCNGGNNYCWFYLIITHPKF